MKGGEILIRKINVKGNWDQKVEGGAILIRI